ncbi:MAG: hypothetical protein JW951_10620 [Lentisphaerae bacterium]|nr:hypothetical protein [Lentisphaerota bacterium]
MGRGAIIITQAGLAGMLCAANLRGSPVLLPGDAAGTSNRSAGALPAAVVPGQDPADGPGVPGETAASPTWGPYRSEAERREIWYAILDQVGAPLLPPATGRVGAAGGGLDTQFLRGVLFGQEKPKPRVVIPAGKPAAGRDLFRNVSKAGLFNLAFAFLILVVLALKGRSGG